MESCHHIAKNMVVKLRLTIYEWFKIWPKYCTFDDPNSTCAVVLNVHELHRCTWLEIIKKPTHFSSCQLAKNLSPFYTRRFLDKCITFYHVTQIKIRPWLQSSKLDHDPFTIEAKGKLIVSFFFLKKLESMQSDIISRLQSEFAKNAEVSSPISHLTKHNTPLVNYKADSLRIHKHCYKADPLKIQIASSPSIITRQIRIQKHHSKGESPISHVTNTPLVNYKQISWEYISIISNLPRKSQRFHKVIPFSVQELSRNLGSIP